MSVAITVVQLMRITTAAQVAILDYENEDLDVRDSKNLQALRECHKELGKLIKRLERDA